MRASSSDPSSEHVDPFDVTWRERTAVLGTLALILAGGWVLGLTFARDYTLELAAWVPASFFALGKFLPLMGLLDNTVYGPYQLGLVIGVMDTCSVLLIVYALEGFYRIAPLKRALTRVQSNARLVLTAYPRMRKAAVFGIFVFVLFPVAGTGAVGAAFIGIFLGMHRVVLIATVSAGGFFGGLTMAFIASRFGDALTKFQAFSSDPVVKYAIIGAIALLLVLGLFALNKAYQRALERAQSSAPVRD